MGVMNTTKNESGFGVCRRVAVALTVVALLGSSAMAQWPQFGGAKRDFKATDARGLADKWDKDGPRVIWMEEIGLGASGVAVVNDVLYATDRNEPNEESVYPRNAISGERFSTMRYPARMTDAFEPKYGKGPVATPLILNRIIYTIGFLGKVQSYDPDIPKVLWEADLFSLYKASPLKYGYTPSPLAYDDHFIVQIGGPIAGLLALDTFNVKPVWASEPFENSYSSPILIKADGQDQIIAMAADRTSAVNPSNGVELWSFPHENRNYAPLAAAVWGDDGMLFLPAGGKGTSHMVEVKKSGSVWNATLVWSSDKDQLGFGNVIRVGDFLYGSSGNEKASSITAVNAKTGEVAWRESGFSHAAMVYGDGKFIIRDADGFLSLATMSPKKMTVHSRAKMFEPGPVSPLALVRNTLYVRDEKKVMAISLR